MTTKPQQPGAEREGLERDIATLEELEKYCIKAATGLCCNSCDNAWEHRAQVLLRTMEMLRAALSGEREQAGPSLLNRALVWLKVCQCHIGKTGFDALKSSDLQRVIAEIETGTAASAPAPLLPDTHGANIEIAKPLTMEQIMTHDGKLATPEGWHSQDYLDGYAKGCADMEATLRPAAPAEEPAAPRRKHELAGWVDVNCKNCGLNIGYWPTKPECAASAAPEKLSNQRDKRKLTPEEWHGVFNASDAGGYVKLTYGTIQEFEESVRKNRETALREKLEVKAHEWTEQGEHISGTYQRKICAEELRQLLAEERSK